MLVVLVNLILTIAVITQVRELQQRVASLPPDLASKRDVAMLRPLRIREILTRNCVDCHSNRRLGVTVSMEPAEIQRTVERMQTHPGANIPPGEFERITASLLVARCARCHGEETLNLMVLKTQPERLATIRRMDGASRLGFTGGSGACHRASVREADWRWRRGVQEQRCTSGAAVPIVSA